MPKPGDGVFDDIITEPVGRLGVRFVGFRNPSVFAKRTLINRSEAEVMLVGHEISLVVPPELEREASRNPKGKAREYFDDPYLHLTPKLTFQFMVEETMDKKTGMPAVQVKKLKKTGEVKRKVLAAHIARFTLQDTQFYSETSKMSAPSWSLPAGPPAAGGSCAAAEIFRKPAALETALGEGDVAQGAYKPKDWICAYCYAGKSNYMHRTSQYSQMARLVWLQGMLKAHQVDGTADVMARTLRAHMANSKYREKVGESTKFFRIHDSGDFQLSPSTYLMWKLVAEQIPSISFWAPTRMWVFPKFNDFVRLNPPPENLSLRPSALHFGDKAPDIEGYDAGSTAHPKVVNPKTSGIADWECPAYKHGGHSCAGAGGPQGEKDCRFCWTYKDGRPSYRSH